MTPYDFFKKLVTRYHENRKPAFKCKAIKRGVSHGTSSYLEDLMAFYLHKQGCGSVQFFTDQQITICSSVIKTKKPDVLLCNEDGLVPHMIELKTDMGFKRDELLQICEKAQRFVDAVNGCDISFKDGEDKKIRYEGLLSKDLVYHVVVASSGNADNDLLQQECDEANELESVKCYILSTGIHPNAYGCSVSDVMKKIKINSEAFKTLHESLLT